MSLAETEHFQASLFSPLGPVLVYRERRWYFRLTILTKNGVLVGQAAPRSPAGASGQAASCRPRHRRGGARLRTGDTARSAAGVLGGDHRRHRHAEQRRRHPRRQYRPDGRHRRGSSRRRSRRGRRLVDQDARGAGAGRRCRARFRTPGRRRRRAGRRCSGLPTARWRRSPGRCACSDRRRRRSTRV